MEVATPVHFLVALRQKLLWIERVGLIVPLLLDSVSLQGCQRVALACLLACADGTVAAQLDPRFDRRLPYVLAPTSTLALAQPPDFLAGA